MHALWLRAPGHVWGRALHVTVAVVKHRQLHDYLALLRLQCLYEMHRNTRQMAYRCRAEPHMCSGEELL
jgi:hypothetical protein